jgi:hypothetical protein
VAPPDDWQHDARVAGLEVYLDQPASEVRAALDRLAAERVSVVELDSELSSYLTDSEFAREIEYLGRLADACHQRGMRAVAYIPSLEVLSADAQRHPRTMAKEHPDWLQIGLDGRPVTFLGGEGRVFWVEEGTESAWMCPTSGYREYFLRRIGAMARTPLDGVWLDVPLLSDIVGFWPCANETCARRFHEDTGLVQPTGGDWEDPVFRRWVAWRHELIWRFEQDVVRAAAAVRPDFAVISETVTMDYNAATLQALDGASHDQGQLIRVWEIDAVSDGSAMRDASPDDWASMAVMMRAARGMSGRRPSWSFCYGKQEDDAERVLALSIATGNAPYETQIPLMCTSVGSAFRRRMYEWIEQHGALFRADSANPAVVLYSTESRDYLDRSAGVGLYVSLRTEDPLWWSHEAQDSAAALGYVGDFRGLATALLRAHVPYDVLPVRRIAELAADRHRLVAAPSLVAASDDTLAALDAYVRAGGTLFVSGPDAGTLDAFGGRRAGGSLLDRLGVPAPEGAEADGEWSVTSHGAGTVVHAPARVGQRLLQGQGAEALPARLRALADRAGARAHLEAPPDVLVDRRRTEDGAAVYLFANLAGLGGARGFAPDEALVTLALPGLDPSRARVFYSAPGEPERELPIGEDRNGPAVSFELAALGALRVGGVFG